ncbi:unnamed protein product [Effrenium voratum]|uniref:Uncharacterized protein n=1 Tax=Effrenium voratum TaxID=2562239 RepID=A0AA36N543_9DINO|nr:unnamed protein product [Effrenium voratum]CAJ1432021.1 unnamed protein product [Effrenium voratum]
MALNASISVTNSSGTVRVGFAEEDKALKVHVLQSLAEVLHNLADMKEDQRPELLQGVDILSKQRINMERAVKTEKNEKDLTDFKWKPLGQQRSTSSRSSVRCHSETPKTPRVDHPRRPKSTPAAFGCERTGFWPFASTKAHSRSD